MTVQPEWVLAIIKQETGGIVQSRFEQHILTRLNNKQGRANLVELRYQAMSQGLGQILGSNYKPVGAESALAIFQSSIADQVLFVARFLARRPKIVSRRNPTGDHFAQLARFYKGPCYAKHHYDESLARWFHEFQSL
ncbi:MAG: N-acetylmuramidase domain-containing protein [Nitrospirales bacterium]